MKKIQYNGSSKILIGIVTKVNLIIDKLVVDVKVNGTSVVVVNQEGEREADIDLSLADQNVKQSPTTSSDNSDYRLLLSKSANDTEETDISRKDTNLKYNPSTGNLQTTKLNGNTVPSGNDTIALTSDIPDELADLADDSTHRLVTDTQITSWNNKSDSDENVKQTDITDTTWRCLAMASDSTKTETTAGVRKTVGLSMQVNQVGTTSQYGAIVFAIGNNIARGNDDNYKGYLDIYNNGKRSRIYSNTTDNRNMIIPDKAGTFALTDDLPINPVLWSENNWLGAKNLLQTPYYDAQKTLNGITWTINEDGSITASGTRATSDSTFYMHTREFEERYDFILPNGTYILSDGGVGNANAEMQMGITKNGAWYTLARTKDGEQSFVANGDDFSNDSISPAVLCIIKSGQTNVNITFKPMIRLASIADNTYVPYAQTNRQLTINKLELSDNAILGAKNLVPFPYYQMKGSVRSVQYEYLPNGGYHLQGTCDSTNNGYVYFTSNQYATAYSIDGSYRTMLIATGTGVENLIFGIAKNVNGTRSALFTSIDANVIQDFSYTGKIDIEVGIKKGTTVDVYVYPILVLSTETDLSWTPYAATNYTLTTQKADYKQIADVELTDTASRAYAIGEYMIWRGDLHRVIASISSGGAITLNTNVYSTSIGDQLRWKASSVSANEIQVKTTNTNIASGNASEIVIEEIRLYADSGVINNWFSCYRHIPLYNTIGYYKDCDFSWWDGNDSYYASISIIKYGNYIVATYDAAKKGSRDITTYSDFKMYITVSEKS